MISGSTYNLTNDAENHLTGVGGAASNTYLYDGDGQRVKETTYENLAYGMPATSDTTLYWPVALTDNDLYANSGTGTSGEFAYTGSGLHYIQLDLGAVYSVDKVKVWHYYNDGRTYHQNKTQVSADGVSWTTIFDSAVSGEYAETSAGHTLTFTARSVRYVRDYLNGSTANGGDHWVEMEVYGARTVAYIGNYYEWDASSSTPTKYYYAGAERVAMRIGTGSGTTGLEWLIDDQLGSTAITADGATGAKLSELRYKPWGELRYAYQATMTDQRYTGQRKEGIGLYDYGARWYDVYLNRWIQPDTIIPDPYNPQDWDRYAYVRNNPVINADPTGHMLDQGGGAASMGDDWWKKRQDKTHSLPKPPLDTKKQWTKNVGDFATLLDSFAALSNGAYAVTGDLVTLACPGCYPLVLAGYRYYSYIPNSISTVSMGLWVGQGFITGENSFSIAQSSSETTVSLSISQDSIAAINTNTIGWLIPEPNVAFALDSAVVGYDYGRSGLGDLIRPQTIPTWINPTFSYNTSNGFNFSWRK